MNGLKNISDKILSDAKLTAESIIADANKSAADIAADAKARAAADIAAAEKAAAAKCADIEEKAKLASQLDGKKLVANERQKMLSQVFSTVLERLCALPEKEYRALLTKLASEVLADGEGGELLMNKRDAKAHGSSLKDTFKGITVSEENPDIAGGLIIRRDKIEYNCTLEAIIRLASENYASEAYNALFPEGA